MSQRGWERLSAAQPGTKGGEPRSVNPPPPPPPPPRNRNIVWSGRLPLFTPSSLLPVPLEQSLPSLSLRESPLACEIGFPLPSPPL